MTTIHQWSVVPRPDGMSHAVLLRCATPDGPVELIFTDTQARAVAQEILEVVDDE